MTKFIWINNTAVMIFFLLLSWNLSIADVLDNELRHYISQIGYRPLTEVQIDSWEMVKLGRKLFADRRLSGNNNISCLDCHSPAQGGGDGIPLGLGEGFNYVNNARRQLYGAVLKRNTPPLFNLAYGNFNMMFWDARVEYDSWAQTYRTPLEKFNDLALTKYLNGALSAQALFPIANHEEMLGQVGENPYAELPTYLVWNGLAEKIFKLPDYQGFLQAAFKNIRRADWNMGLLARAISNYEAYAFSAIQTPWDKYLRGDNNAMSEAEKKGAIIFSTPKGRCFVCHNSDHLTNFSFHNIGIPSIGYNDDQGRVFGQNAYLFRTPPLRNVALTAPYMHNGSLTTLREVIEHYVNPMHSLYLYDIEALNTKYAGTYNVPLKWLDTDASANYKMETLSPPLRTQLILSDEDKNNLLLFLEKSLTDTSYFSRL
ncbi:MAG: hypothetical protein JNM93_01430 [Bacteriovoracaceae bacterium]|nr:hypothetical protein [Bacteriovoracaceae bacterium]